MSAETVSKTEELPFWERPFPLLYKCKRCGKYLLMRTAEPWAGHLCNMPVDFWKLSNKYRAEVWRTHPELNVTGELAFIAEAPESLKIWNGLKESERGW